MPGLSLAVKSYGEIVRRRIGMFVVASGDSVAKVSKKCCQRERPRSGLRNLRIDEFKTLLQC